MRDLQPEKSMTIKEVADSLGVSYALVIKRVNEIFPDKVQNGKITYLNEYEVTAISMRIKENSSLSPSFDDRKSFPKTDLEKELIIQQAAMFQAEKIQFMMAQISEMKPKADLADKALRDENEHYSITQAGKHLNIRQSVMFKILRDNKLLTKESLPTQKALDYEVLQIRTNPCDDGRNRQQSIMTMQNIFNFKERYCK